MNIYIQCKLHVIQVYLIWCLKIQRIDSNLISSKVKSNRVLLISFDGFRWDYLHNLKQSGYKSPNFDYFIENGVTVDEPGVTNTFVTKTFPNHYTIATGMHEEKHGVIANNMLDPLYDEHFTLSDVNDTSNAFWFNNGTDQGQSWVEPIWNRNQDFGGKTGVCFWPGSEAPVNNQLPHYYKIYSKDHFMSNESRIDTVINWFTGADPINLGLLYFNEPDHTGHRVGPESDHMLELLSKLDDLIGYLIKKLKEHNIFEDMNIIITSDHGMSTIKYLIEMDRYIDPTLYDKYGGSPIWNIISKEGKEEEVLQKLQNVPNVHVYRKEEIPTEYHYKYNRRILPILVEAEEFYSLCNTLQDPWCKAGGGIHGYNNSLSSMHPFFIAHGPAFKRNFVAKPFRNVDIYPLLCFILGIDPPNTIDGKLENVIDIIRQPKIYYSDITLYSVSIALCFTSLIALGFCIRACCNQLKRKTVKRHMVQLENIEEHSEIQLLNSGDEDEEADVF